MSSLLFFGVTLLSLIDLPLVKSLDVVSDSIGLHGTALTDDDDSNVFPCRDFGGVLGYPEPFDSNNFEFLFVAFLLISLNISKPTQPELPVRFASLGLSISLRALIFALSLSILFPIQPEIL